MLKSMVSSPDLAATVLALVDDSASVMIIGADTDQGVHAENLVGPHASAGLKTAVVTNGDIRRAITLTGGFVLFFSVQTRLIC
jgi:hypothetical protein